MDGDKNGQRSIYEDASALLMLSRGKDESPSGQAGIVRAKNTSSSTSPRSRQGSYPHSEPHSPLTTPHLSNKNPSMALRQSQTSTSPGPAYATLTALDEDLNSGVRDKASSSSSRSNSNKGIVAAAALAAAADIPLPLRKQETDCREGKVHTKDSQSSGRKSKRAWPVPDSYVVDPDSGIITCICGYDDDDGFTIQCDHCNRWQHAICHGIRDIETAPDDYLCSSCHPRKLDVKKAKKRQQERLNPKTNKKRRRSNQDEDVRNKSNASPVSDTASTTNNSGGHDMVPVSETKTTQKLLNPVEHYGAVYVPLEVNDFKDRYVKMFIEKHSDDDWVISYNSKSFIPVPLEVKSYSEHSRSFTGLSKMGLFVKQACPVGTYIEEVLGEVDFSKKYYADPRNNYRIFGTTKPKVFLHPHWPIYIDCRLSGNITRFMRRSCYPNVELVSIRMNDESNVKFVLRALRDIDDDEELQIGWQWDLSHPIWHLIKGENKTVDSLDDPDKFTLVHSIDNVLATSDCGCGSNNKECYLLKVKKFSQSLIKSVKSKMNSRYKLNEILHRAQNVDKKRQAPILSRLAHEAISNAERANELLVDFHAAKLKFLKEEGIPVSKVPGRRFSGSELGLGNGKPFKLYLVDRHFTTYHGSSQTATRRPSTLSTVSNPLTYDESHISDLKQLPLPIDMQLPSLTSMPNEAISLRDAPRRESLGDFGSKAPLPINSQLPAATVAVGPVVDSRHSLKKKLSFADYKKKMKPV